MDGNDVSNTLLVYYKLHTRIIDLQSRMIALLKTSPEERQLIDSLETLIDELKGVLK